MLMTFEEFKAKTIEDGYSFLDKDNLIKGNVIYRIDESCQYIKNGVAYCLYSIIPTGEYKNCETCRNACSNPFHGEYLISCGITKTYIGVLGDDAKEHCCDSWEY